MTMIVYVAGLVSFIGLLIIRPNIAHALDFRISFVPGYQRLRV